MLIAPQFHPFGLVFIAVLISAVHAMPTPLEVLPAPPEVLPKPISPRLLFYFSLTEVGWEIVTFTDKVKSLLSWFGTGNTWVLTGQSLNETYPFQLLMKKDSSLSTSVRLNAIAITDKDGPALDITELAKLQNPMTIGTSDKKKLSASTTAAIGKEYVPDDATRYTNKVINDESESIDKMYIFILEAQNDAPGCHGELPCVGWRAPYKTRTNFYKVYQLDSKLDKLEPKFERKHKDLTKPALAAEAEYDKQFWKLLPRTKLEEQWTALKTAIEPWDNERIKEEEESARLGRQKSRTKERHLASPPQSIAPAGGSIAPAGGSIAPAGAPIVPATRLPERLIAPAPKKPRHSRGLAWS
ncbi:hypothetical protein BDP27DRAFT_1445029 [Rhodocollybia butyracea]|uniref:Uncharacterized protein n=1 Tax=Rhodocollybia butyracea TaxID=206335 RepID=A0A9P5UCP4_9AGAR|nr:hypothetical protein BDP27DRAFT_1445029 [Rhodocollybia butyracea]